LVDVLLVFSKLLADAGERIEDGRAGGFQPCAAVVAIGDKNALYAHRFCHFEVVQGVADEQNV